MYTQTEALAQFGGHALVLTDTTELNYHQLNGLLKVNDPDIGTLSDNRSTGLLLHPGLAVDAATGAPLGLSSISIWQRRFGRKILPKSVREKRPIEEKESYKWIDSAKESQAHLSSARGITMVSDRESDIYEYFCLVPDPGIDILVRSKSDRSDPEGIKIRDRLDRQAWEGSVELEIREGEKRKGRKTQLQLRWQKVEVAKPDRQKKRLETYPEQVSMQVIEVMEKPEYVPEGEPPVFWRLFTTHEVSSLADALTIVEWYKYRWWIEELFRILKTQGLEVEKSQFGKGMALKKLIVVCLEVARKILVLRQERQGKAGYPAQVCFSQEEQTFLVALQPQLEGKTQKQKNPFEKGSLAWAAWLIAILGGWKAADLNKRPPGPITFARGLKVFAIRRQGWNDALTFFSQKSKGES